MGVPDRCTHRKSTAKAVCCSESREKEKRSPGRLAREHDGAEEAAENGMRAVGAAGGTKREAETEKEHTEADDGAAGDASEAIEARRHWKTEGRRNSRKCRESDTDCH